VLNWQKCHFMVQEGVVLGHMVSSMGLEVDKARSVEVIEKLPLPTNVKEVRLSGLGHAGFSRRFLKKGAQLLVRNISSYSLDC
jgi:hypothetical protein